MVLTIAHYRISDALTRVAVLVSPILLLYILSVYEFREHGWSYVTDRPLLLPIFVIAHVGGLLVLLMTGVVIKRIAFENGRAVWIENGTVIFLHEWNIAARCHDIVNVFGGTSGRFNQRSIILQLSNGTTKAIPVSSLIEPEHEIIARLKSAISAPPEVAH